MNRRNFLKRVSLSTTSLLFGYRFLLASKRNSSARPNVILVMTDDQGWADTGYNGHPVLKTPNLDQVAKEGIRFERFYSGAPVCSPTRGSCLTGRHPYRYGIYHANVGHMKKQEIVLAEVLKMQGYTTGHFGKWHLGTLTKTVEESNRGGKRGAAHYSPPWENGFDECFSTEARNGGIPSSRQRLTNRTTRTIGQGRNKWPKIIFPAMIRGSLWIVRLPLSRRPPGGVSRFSR
jgi:arylsulfatase A-like enzyme